MSQKQTHITEKDFLLSIFPRLQKKKQQRKEKQYINIYIYIYNCLSVRFVHVTKSSSNTHIKKVRSTLYMTKVISFFVLSTFVFEALRKAELTLHVTYRSIFSPFSPCLPMFHTFSRFFSLSLSLLSSYSQDNWTTTIICLLIIYRKQKTISMLHSFNVLVITMMKLIKMTM